MTTSEVTVTVANTITNTVTKTEEVTKVAVPIVSQYGMIMNIFCDEKVSSNPKSYEEPISKLIGDIGTKIAKLIETLGGALTENKDPMGVEYITNFTDLCMDLSSAFSCLHTIISIYKLWTKQRLPGTWVVDAMRLRVRVESNLLALRSTIQRSWELGVKFAHIEVRMSTLKEGIHYQQQILGLSS